ncbi:MAG: flagellar hook-length control protein FliK [Pirellulales bacterium]|nr:flagellar hook-length control protein FliK [Pirellulales bacterium]
MNQTPIEHLFQVLAPKPERLTGVGRGNDCGPGFGDHLSQASATATDALGPSSRAHEPSSPRSERPGHRVTDPPVATSSSDHKGYCPSCDPALDSRETDGSTDQTGGASSQSDDHEDATQASHELSSSAQGDHSDHEEDSEEIQDVLEEAALVGAGIAQPIAGQSGLAIDSSETNGELALGPGDETVGKRTQGANDPQQESDSTAEGSGSNETFAEKLAAVEESAEGVAVTLFDSVEEGSVGKIAEPQANDPSGTLADAAEAEKLNRSRKSGAKAKDEVLPGNTNTPDATEPGEASGVRSAISDTSELSAEGSSRTAENLNGSEQQREAHSEDKSSRSDQGDTPSTARGNRSGEVKATVATAVANRVNGIRAGESSSDSPAKDSGEGATKPVAGSKETALGPLGRALRSPSEAVSSGRGKSVQEGPHIDPARFVGRVAKALQTATERGGKLQLRLNPPELGALRIELTLKDGAMSAALEADNSTARQLLLEHLPALRDRLAEQNIRLERFDVDVRQEGQGGQANPRGSNQNPQQHEQPTDTHRTTRHGIGTNEQREPVGIGTPGTIGNSNINMVV